MLRVSGLTKSFGVERVLVGIDLTLGANETLAILGRSGSGKTTLLKILAGLETADAGNVEAAPGRIVYLYQEPLLFPHLDLLNNLAFGPRLGPHDRATVEQEARAMLRELGLEGHGHKMVDALSGAIALAAIAFFKLGKLLVR